MGTPGTAQDMVGQGGGGGGKRGNGVLGGGLSLQKIQPQKRLTFPATSVSSYFCIIRLLLADSMQLPVQKREKNDTEQLK